MSKQAVADFLTKLHDDQTIQDALPDVMAMKQGQPDAIAELGKKHGFDFSADELKEVVSATVRFEQGELSEADLAAVTGGASASEASKDQQTQLKVLRRWQFLGTPQ